MKTKQLLRYGVTSVLSVSAFLFLAMAPAAAASNTEYKWTGASSGTAGLGGCTSNCWSVAGNWNVSTDGGTTWVGASTAPQSTDNSGAGDDLVFDGTALTTTANLTNDLTNLTVDTINSIGTANTGVYNVGGNSLTVTAGTTSTSGVFVGLSNNVSLSSSQNYGAANKFSTIALQGTLTVPSGVTLTALSPISISTLSGGGSIIFAGTTNTSPNFHSILNSSSNFSGSLDIQSGAVLQVTDPANLGTAALTIENGGQLSINSQGAAATSSLTVANNITVSGNGAAVQFQNKGAISASYFDTTSSKSADATVTFSGLVNLVGDTGLSSVYPSNVTYNFTNLKTNGHALTAVAQDQPTYGATTILVNGVAQSASAAVKAPKTPNTGLALVAARPLATFAVSTAAAVVLALMARQLKSAKR
jgi:hypothetical protein